MPGNHAEGLSSGPGILCVRCQSTSAIVVVRTEYICRDCFVNYVGSKIAKRMDGFKVRGTSKDKKRRLLLPLSLGVSSVTLLHVLDNQLHIQEERMSRTGYELHVLHVLDSLDPTESNSMEVLRSIKERYPLHTYATASLDDGYEYISKSQNKGTLSEEDSSAENIRPSEYGTVSHTLQECLGDLPSATSRADMISILRTMAIVENAKTTGCECILWGDSTTRLAERTLAETAKGRGLSIPWQTSDGRSPYGVDYLFPLRDLLRKELLTFYSVIDPSMTTVYLEKKQSASASASSREVTVDNLMTQYFETVEQIYPSIVSNVVRTSGRLQPASCHSENSVPCKVCRLPVAHGTEGLYNWKGDQKVAKEVIHNGSPLDEGHPTLCYGCSRTVLG